VTTHDAGRPESELHIQNTMPSQSSALTSFKHFLVLLPAGLLLFILPFSRAHTPRLITLLCAGIVVAAVWRRCAVPPVPLKIPFLLWIVVAFMSLLWAHNPGYSLGEIRNEIGYGLITFLTFYCLTGTRRERDIWTVILMAGLAVMSAFALYYYGQHGGWLSEGAQGGVGGYSTYLITILPVVAVMLAQTPLGKFPGNFLWLLVPLVLITGYLTLNRAFWPTVGVEIISFSLLLWGVKHHLKPSKWMLVAMAALVGLASFQFINVAKQKSSPDLSAPALVGFLSKDVRLELWQYSADLIAQRPLTGVGFGKRAAQDILEKQFRPGLDHSHNLFVNYALQMGLPGLAVIVLLFLAVLREFWCLYRSSESDLVLIGIGGIVLVLGVITKNMTDDFFFRESALLFWAIVGIALGYGKRRLRQSSASSGSETQELSFS